MSPNSHFSRALVVAAATFLFQSVVTAQTAGGSNVSCTYAFWEYNSLDQSPCVVWGQLQSLCISGGITVTPLLNSSYQYSPPAVSSEINECNCNVVSYNLMAACSWCQPNIYTSNWVTEATWESGCGTQYDATGLTFTPTGVDIPAWAYISDNGSSWDPDIASAAAASSSTALPTSTSLPTSAGTPTQVSASATPTEGFLPSASVTGGASQSSGGAGTLPTATGSSVPATNGGGGGSTTSGSGTNIGAIVGGVVGGVAALIIIGLIIFFCLRRKRQSADPYQNNKVPLSPGPAGMSPQTQQMSFAGAGTGPGTFDGSASYTHSPSPPQQAPYAVPYAMGSPAGDRSSTAGPMAQSYSTSPPPPGYGGGWTPQPYGTQGGYGQPNPQSYVQSQGGEAGPGVGQYRGLPEA